MSKKQPKQSPQSNREVMVGILWIASPLIVLFGNLILNVALRAVGVNSVAVNIFSVIAGVAGVLLVFIGPIFGIIKLTRK